MQFGIGHPPPIHQLQSICVGGVQGSQIFKRNSIILIRSKVMAFLVILLSSWSPCCPHIVPVIPTSSLSSPHCPHSPQKVPMWSLWLWSLLSPWSTPHVVPVVPTSSPSSPRCPCVVPIISTLSRRSPHHPLPPRYPLHPGGS